MRRDRVSVVLVGFFALVALASACGKKEKAPDPAPTAKNSAATPTAKGTSSAASKPGDDDDDGDDDGDDGDKAPVAKQSSAKADADEEEQVRKRVLARDVPDAEEAAKTAPPPKVIAKKDARGGCGEIQVGTKTIKMDCDDQDYAKVKNASQPLLGEEDLMGGAAPVKLPDVVDFHERKLTGPVLDQGATLTCTAMSLAAVVNHEIALKTGKPGNISPMHIWGRYANPRFDQAIHMNEGKPIVPWQVLPYDPKVADKWDKTKPPPLDLLAKLEPKAVVKIVDVAEIGLKDIKGTLAQGHAVWFGLAAAHNMQKTVGPKGGPQIIPAYDWKKAPPNQQMGHAIAMVGYRTGKSGKTYYKIQNSWGPEWGTDGYAYIDEDTLARNLRGAYTVEVDVVGQPPAQPMGAAPTKCKHGQLPDAATGKCALACPDGSARNSGVCAEAGECPQGTVNVKGRCVRAAPPIRVKKNGFAIHCVPGGCLYGFAKGVAGCPRDKGCVIACPSPTFKLVKTASGIRCN
jgi:hypothetical protein